MNETQAQNTVNGTISAGIVTSTVTVQSWNFCPNCGQKLEAGWRHCAGCGRAIGLLAAPISWPTYPGLFPNSPWDVPSGPFWYGTFPGTISTTDEIPSVHPATKWAEETVGPPAPEK